jgi:diaminopimelate epimerase
MNEIAFEKYEGLGNDFLIVTAEREEALNVASVRVLTERRRGVGGDGVLLVLPPVDAENDGRMKVLNADGSVPEMCGNGLRCVALYLARRQSQLARELRIETDAGVRTCAVDDEGGRGTVTVDMGPVRYLEDRNVDALGHRFVLALADAGNPHAVTFEPATRELIDHVGLSLATHPAFPRGTNVEFASMVGEGIDLVVWERGVGLTLACGTGACAAAAVACAKGLAPWDCAIQVNLPGGALSITMRRADGHASMQGPARHVFSGVWRASVEA